MLKVKIDGVYESEVGSGQKDFIPFSYEYETVRFSAKGLFTHSLRRHAPYLIQNDKKNAKALFSKIKSLVITDVKKINDECTIAGKDIFELDAWELQELACLYDLYEIPLHGTFSIVEIREKAALAYLERVLKVPMKSNKDKDKLAFFEKQDDGTYRLKTEEMELPVQIFDDYLEKKQKEVQKKDLSYFMAKAKEEKQNADEEKLDEDDSLSDMPSLEDLTN